MGESESDVDREVASLDGASQRAPRICYRPVEGYRGSADVAAGAVHPRDAGGHRDRRDRAGADALVTAGATATALARACPGSRDLGPDRRGEPRATRPP